MYLNKQQGFSLVELMISLVLGTLVIAMISSLYVSGIVNNINSIKYSRMKTDLQAVMHLMESDIRRAGFRGDSVSYAMGLIPGGNPFMWEESGTVTINGISTAVSIGVATKVFSHGGVANSCILFMYDVNKNGGSTEATDRFGYRLQSGAIQLGTSIPLNPTACDTGTWEKISDPSAIKVTNLKFSPSTITSERTRMRLINIELIGETSIASKTATEKITSEIQIRNLEMFRK